jgi:aldose 1-epimerase
VPPADVATTTTSPSGVQHEIAHGAQLAVVTEIGATLRVYDVHGAGVVDGFGDKDICPSARGQVLAPWPNRLAGGRYTIDGINAQAALDDPERACAIHGLVRWLPWQMTSRAQNVVVLGCTLHPQPGYPWRLDISIEYRLGRSGLTVSTEVTNRDQHAAPFGLGFHPYLSVGTSSVDVALLRLPARRRLLSDDRGLPTGETVVTGTDFDFRDRRVIGPTRLDTAFGDFDRDGDGRARIELDDARGRGATVWMDDQFHYVMAYTADTVEPASRRRTSVAIEPMTCPPNALRSGADLIRLEPGRSWRAAWGIEPRKSPIGDGAGKGGGDD